MSTTSPTAPLASGDDAGMAGAALSRVKEYLAHHPSAPRISLVDDEANEELVVPREAVELLARILAHMAVGEGVSVVPRHAELTTQQAADLLNVSRPYFIKLLETGMIEHHLVGKHRRVRAQDLMEYRRKDDQHRREEADKLSALTQELGPL